MKVFRKETYGRILIPMVTPFAEDQSVDYAKAKKLAQYLVDKKKGDTLILSGTTGEFHSQTFDERVRLFEAVKEAVGGKIPLIAGIGCASTIETIALGRKAAALGFEPPHGAVDDRLRTDAAEPVVGDDVGTPGDQVMRREEILRRLGAAEAGDAEEGRQRG